MWKYDNDYNEWSLKKDILEVEDFEYFKQEFDSFRFYSKCLSGTSYTRINDISNIYDILSLNKPKTWHISNIASNYSFSQIPQNFPVAIDEASSNDYYNKFNTEYGFTQKNLFTPERAINDSVNNFISVDAATIKELNNLNDVVENRIIDGVRLKEGNKILVKDQKETIVLDGSTDPNEYFEGEFEQINLIGTNVEYEFFSSENGIYLYSNNRLIKQDTLDNYDNCIKFSVVVEQGNINDQKQFHLTRLKSGYFPTTSLEQPIHFKEKKNWLLRNQVDYNNLFDINYYDVIKHDTQQYNTNGVTYSIPKRIISVGEFGVIVNNQSDVSNIIRNKYKVILRSITQTDKYYWIVGDSGTLLRVRKHDFDIKKINLNKLKIKLNSISFFDNLNGVLVGNSNTILITKDGGINWMKKNIEAFEAFDYNTVLFKDVNNFYIGGNNGVFLNFKKDNKGWTAYKRRISKFLDKNDDFLLVDNINKIINVKLNSDNPWQLSYNFNGVLSTSISEFSTSANLSPLIDENKDLLFIVTDNNNIIIHDVANSIPFYTDFIYMVFKNKNYNDIKEIEIKDGTDEIYFTGFDQSNNNSGIFSFNLSYFTNIGYDNKYTNIILSENEANFISNESPNSLFDYNGEQLILAGNNSLLEYTDYDEGFTFSQIDENFEDKFQSKLLFLDYDIAGKLNFFTDSGEYRLPNDITFEFSNNINSYLKFEPLTTASSLTQSDISWWQYWQDSESTFEYYANNNEMTDYTKVFPSGLFKYDSLQINLSIDQNLTTTDITSNLDDIKKLTPTITEKGHTRFSQTGTLITEPDNNFYDIYLYDYIMVLKFYDDDIDIKGFKMSVDVGDVIRLESESIKSNFLVNKIFFIPGRNYKYAYLYTDFNDGVINSILDDGFVKVTNLNKFKNIKELRRNFNLHPISKGYNMELVDGISNFYDIKINAKFNNITSYYNLATKVITHETTQIMKYKDSFLKFGYKPTYNLLDYLEKLNDSVVNPKFFDNKEFLSMPVYIGIPSSDTEISDDKCYFDKSNKFQNKIIFGKDLKFEWNSLFINTFIDIDLIGGAQITTEKLLVVNKYYNKEIDSYVIEFHKKIDFNDNLTLIKINIKSRRTLLEISNDLEYLNNIQRPYINKKYDVDGDWEPSHKTLEKYINFKVNTDSYAKILLSDNDIVSSLSGLIYTDYKGELSLNITRLESNNEINISNTSNLAGSLLVTCSTNHNLSTGDGVILEFNTEGGSADLNQQYIGYRIVTYINDYTFSTDVDFGVNVNIGNDKGKVIFTNSDPFLNYHPVDIIDVGVNKKPKKSIQLDKENVILNKNVYSLINVDFDRYRFRLIDGLNLESLSTNYDWMLEAEITDAIIGENENGVVWYKGNWECGRWLGGTWVSGNWISGDWYKGKWLSREINDNFSTIEISNNISKNNSKWFTGRWYDGEWENGIWENGRWYGGYWNDGTWNNGIWNNGTWNNGYFTGGVWVFGTWNGGKFAALNAPSYWIDGEWKSGDFENGLWFNGSFGSKDKESNFGLNAYNSRGAIWKSGNWINGSFHSRVNIDDNGDFKPSESHKYSEWHTGNWFGGNFYGGIAYNIDFKSGIWHGGILEDVDIVEVSLTENYFSIEGLSEYNIGYEISIMKDYEVYNYIIISSEEDVENNITKLYVSDINSNMPTESLKLVSKFRNCNWKSGIWTNGIYENGIFEGGVWLDGIFLSDWG